MNANVSKLLNEQINKEFYSAYLYLDFANYYAAVGLDGFENWYRVQAQEERDHAMLFYQYLQNNGEGVTFEAIAKPEWVWGDRIFEKCGIRRDEEGDGGKTLEIRGKRRLSARDGGANYQQS